MIRRLSSALFSLVVVVGGLVAVAAPVAAATQGTACGVGDPEHVRLWENTTSDTSDGNDSLWFCGTSIEDLRVSPAWGLGALEACHRDLIDRSSWNDCISSVTLWVPQGRRLCLYADAQYKTVIANYPGPWIGQRQNLASSANDRLSSLKFVNLSAGC